MRKEPKVVIDLAHVESFHLAGVTVDPASRMIRSSSGEAKVQPRVMQVLVALSRANGAVLSRNDLIEQCWGGRVVGDNAIHRAISRIRDIASEFGAESMEVATVKGVGYRLRSANSANQPVQDVGANGRLPVSRRAIILGATASGAAIAIAAWGRWPAERASRLALDHYNHAEALTKSSTASDWNDQALRQYRAAVDESPGFASAWSGLAFSYVRKMNAASDAEVDSVAAQALGAAGRALDLDPGELRARAALALMAPSFGRWSFTRARLEGLGANEKSDWEIPFAVAKLHLSTGDYDRAMPIYEQLLHADASNLQVNRALVRVYWTAARFHELEWLLEKAQREWPRDHSIWSTAFNYLVTAGRYDRARLLLEETSRYPSDLWRQAIALRQSVLRAVETGGDNERDAAVSLVLSLKGEPPQSYVSMASVLALVGANQPLLSVLDGYYFGEGEYRRQLARYSRRATDHLFTPFFDPVRSDPDFRAFMSKLRLPPEPRVPPIRPSTGKAN